MSAANTVCLISEKDEMLQRLARAAPTAVGLWHRAWPLAGVALALILTLAWIGLLGYLFTKLVL